MSRKFVLSALIVAVMLLSAIPAALGWTVEDCIEVDYDHPDCDQYPTTTTYQTTTSVDRCEYNPNHPFCTTTTPSTTTTEVEVTTTTQPPTTTVGQQETTTTTAAPCAAGLIHQPPLCVDPSTTTVPIFDTTTVPATVPTTPEGEESLPFTGMDPTLLASLGGFAGVSGAFLIRKAKDKS